MTFAESVSYCLTNYAKFTGRGSRSEYWWFILAYILAGIAASVVDRLIGRTIFDTLISLGAIVPTLAVASRRLHDTDRSGWWQLLGLIPLIGVIVLVVWLAAEGTPGANRFGPEPVRGPIR